MMYHRPTCLLQLSLGLKLLSPLRKVGLHATNTTCILQLSLRLGLLTSFCIIGLHATNTRCIPLFFRD